MRNVFAALLTGVCLGGLALLWTDRAPQARTLQGQAPAATAANVLYEPPGRDSFAAITGDTATLVNGRRVTPVGRVIRTMSYAWGMTMDPERSRAAILTERSLEIVGMQEPYTKVRYPPPAAPKTKLPSEFGTGTYMGVAFSPDGARIYFGSANDGQVKAMDIATGRVVQTIDVNTDGYKDSYVGDFVLTRDGRTLYVLDQFNYRLAVVDLAAARVVRSVRVGRNPFAIALSPDEQTAWVTNVGMFEYPLLPGVTKENRKTSGLVFPAYGVPSKEAEEGTKAEGLDVPGLGPLNHPDAMSVFKVDLPAGRVVEKIHTGYLVGADRQGIKTVGGASPGAVVAGKRAIFVANATNDSISIIDAATGKLDGHIELAVPGEERLRGILPFTMALAPDESRLYVACAGLNAVAVIDTRSRRVLGYIPAGWFCALVSLSADGQTLFISSAKGLGSGPNGGANFVAPPDRSRHPGEIMQGTLQVLPVPDEATLQRYTQQVVENTYVRRDVDPSVRARLPFSNSRENGPIKHIVFIVKENRTYDQVFGQRTTANGDATLTTLGLKMRLVSEDKTRVLESVDVSPNHHALADRFAMSDNFYCDSDQSNTGHRWVAGVYPNEWVETNARSEADDRVFSEAPGRRYVAGAAAAVLPEDYNEAGALWEHLDRNKVSFYNFGFGAELPANIEDQMQRQTGIRMAVSFPMAKPLFDRSSRTYPTFNMAIPDQYRVDMFEEELRDRWISGKEPFPSLITMVLPNDHMTHEEKPKDGYPFIPSYFADNDLALGRVIQTLQATPWWKDTLVIVTEDDPQGGYDHVDAHRSLLLFIGPRVKRGYVSHRLANFGSLMRLIFTLLNMPPLNQFDGAATVIDDIFTDEPDLTPYRAKGLDKRLFDPDVAFKPFDRRFNWKAIAESPIMDDPDDMRAGYERDGDRDDKNNERNGVRARRSRRGGDPDDRK
jgi:YVTN family beta-propeller protein